MIGPWRRRPTRDRRPFDDDGSIRLTVASLVPGADFNAVLCPLWTVGQEIQPENRSRREISAIAVDHLREVTERHAGKRVVTHYATAELEINRELMVPRSYTEPLEFVVSGTVGLTPSDDSRAPTEDYLASLRDERIRNDRMRDRLEFYRRQVFAQSDLAWLWWVDQRPEKLDVLTVEAFTGLLDELKSARKAGAVVHNEQNRDSFGGVIADFINRTDPGHARLAVGLLRQYLMHFKESDLVKRVDQLASQSVASSSSDVKVIGEE
jgi:hypothetical protein